QRLQPRARDTGAGEPSLALHQGRGADRPAALLREIVSGQQGSGRCRRTALVTGSAQGVGAAIAEALLERGDAVVLVDRDEAGNRRTAARLDPGGERTEVLTLDLR